MVGKIYTVRLNTMVGSNSIKTAYNSKLMLPATLDEPDDRRLKDLICADLRDLVDEYYGLYRQST